MAIHTMAITNGEKIVAAGTLEIGVDYKGVLVVWLWFSHDTADFRSIGAFRNDVRKLERLGLLGVGYAALGSAFGLGYGLLFLRVGLLSRSILVLNQHLHLSKSANRTRPMTPRFRMMNNPPLARNKLLPRTFQSLS